MRKPYFGFTQQQFEKGATKVAIAAGSTLVIYVLAHVIAATLPNVFL